MPALCRQPMELSGQIQGLLGESRKGSWPADLGVVLELSLEFAGFGDELFEFGPVEPAHSPDRLLKEGDRVQDLLAEPGYGGSMSLFVCHVGNRRSGRTLHRNRWNRALGARGAMGDLVPGRILAGGVEPTGHKPYRGREAPSGG